MNAAHEKNEAPALALMQSLVQDALTQVNAVMTKALRSPVPLIPELGTHLLAAGGKRLRPMLTLAAAKLCDAPMDKAVALAACVEFIHAATLLHDDVIDESKLRRGQPTANAVWGNKASVLVGDFLFARAFELMVEQGNLDVLALLSQTAVRLSEGEVLQLSVTGDLTLTVEDCVSVMSAKTAPLFEASTGVGALLAGASQQQGAALRTYGHCLGVCFQIVDDILDYVSADSAFGKDRGGDFLERKVTLPVVYAYAHASSGERTFWQEAYAKGDGREHYLERVLLLLESHGAYDKALEMAQAYARDALNALDAFPDSAHKRALQETVYFSLSRKI